MTDLMDFDIARFIHLSASAGSGKTRALTKRYVALLKELTVRGLNIDQAVAITFTDKAAAEIKERVLGALPEDLLKMIIRGRQDLRISTIHSFCMNLLKRYPLEAGLPPDFGILDERDKTYKVRQAVEAALEDLDRDRGVMEPLREFSTNDLVGLVELLLSLRTRLKRMEIDAGGPAGLLRALRRGMELDRAAVELKTLLAGLEWKTVFRRVADLVRELGEDPAENRVAEHCVLGETCDAEAAYRSANALLNLYSTKEGTPRKKPWLPKGKRTAKAYEDYKEAYLSAQDLFFRFRDFSDRVRAGSEAESMIRLYLRAEEHYLDLKLREGLLDFDDLEIFAYRLLKGQESPDILYWLDRKVLHYLVDEFQDTSDIQWAVLDRLTEEIFSGQGAVKPMQPSLFVVGDKKQSIYRFREANYRLIDDVRQAMEALPKGTQEIRTLDRNYRSVPEVIGAVNTVFSALWQQEYQNLKAARTEHRGTVKLIEVLPPAGPEDLTEAVVLAREIRRLVNAETPVQIKVKDKDVETWKSQQTGYSDCAILIQSRTRLKEYEAALLAEGVPFRVVGGIGFYEEDEVQAIISVLFYLWNHDDRMALASALKSALFGLTDRDLEALLSGGGSLTEALRRLFPDIAAMLERWRALAGVMPLAPLMHRIIADTGAYVRFGRRRAQAIFNLDKLLDTAREFDRRGYTTLQDFVGWVQSMRESEQREATADMNLPGDQGAVSIMTVHKAKGLEFPVVFLPGMNQQTRSLKTGPDVIVEAAKDGRMRMAGPDRDNPVYEELWDREQAELRQEHQRLLYVAMTRACDHLIMTGTLAGGRKPDRLPTASSNTWLQYLHTAIPGLDRQEGDAAEGILSFTYPDWKPQPITDDRQATPGSALGEREQQPVIDPAAIIENISPLPQSDSIPWKKATDFLLPLKEQDIPRDAACLSPLTRGSFFHRCLDLAATSGSFDLERVMREFPEVLALPLGEHARFQAEAEQILRSVTGNEELAWIFKQHAGSYSELPFLYRKEHEIISGIIDRLIVKDGTGYVIDYKSIAVGNDEVLQSWIDHYRPQVRIYCEAAKEIFRLEHVEGFLLFLDSGRLAMMVKI
jgi:ATP-dependent helicase/nuclease subunit A